MPADWDDDDRLFAALREAMREYDEVPPAFVEMAKAMFTLRDIDAELAELTYDSLVHDIDGDQALALTRADPAPLRALTCASPELTIELEIAEEALLGQVVPPGAGEIDLYDTGGLILTSPVDDVGAFTIRPVPAGPFRLHYRSATTSVLTTWITL